MIKFMLLLAKVLQERTAAFEAVKKKLKLYLLKKN
jgi:hypothetical protein